jgi:hypothetical protein
MARLRRLELPRTKLSMSSISNLVEGEGIYYESFTRKI